MFLLRQPEALKLVDACRTKKILILGIEAFRLADQYIMPDTDFIADYSELAAPGVEDAWLKSADAAEQYLNEAALTDSGFWFEFVLADDVDCA
jgi:hypothetical protein